MRNYERVRVVARIRPFISSDPDDAELSTIVIDKKHVSVNGKYVYSVDAIYPMEVFTEDIFKEVVEPLINDFLSGYNITIMAYGQTGTGKTYTVSGLTPFVLEKIVLEGFQGNIEELSFQFIEVYGDTIRDLLSENPAESSKNLQVYDDASMEGGTLVTGAVRIRARTLQQVVEVVEYGTRMRVTGSTNIHEYSSRSHSILTIFNHRDKSKLHLVDLAGSERASKTLNAGQRFQESIGINVGLLALGNVIRALRRNHSQGTRQHVPYRSSKLTRLLQDSLGGNSRTVFIACIAPDSYNRDETKRTLEYCTLAQQILNAPIPNYSTLCEEQNYGESKNSGKTEKNELQRGGKNIMDEKNSYDIVLPGDSKVPSEIEKLQGVVQQLNQKVGALRKELKKDEKIFRKQICEIQRLEEENKMWRRRVDFLEGRPCNSQCRPRKASGASAVSIVERIMRLHGLDTTVYGMKESRIEKNNTEVSQSDEMAIVLTENSNNYNRNEVEEKEIIFNNSKWKENLALDAEELPHYEDSATQSVNSSDQCAADITKKILSYQIENAHNKGKIISLEALLDKQCRESAMLRVELAQIRNLYVREE